MVCLLYKAGGVWLLYVSHVYFEALLSRKKSNKNIKPGPYSSSPEFFFMKKVGKWSQKKRLEKKSANKLAPRIFFLCQSIASKWTCYGLLIKYVKWTNYLLFLMNLGKVKFFCIFILTLKSTLSYCLCLFMFYGIPILSNSLSYFIWYLEQTVTTKVYIVFIPKTLVILLWNLKFLSKHSYYICNMYSSLQSETCNFFHDTSDIYL